MQTKIKSPNLANDDNQNLGAEAGDPTTDRRATNRINNERLLTSLALQIPLLAVNKADDLLNIRWHDGLCKLTIEKALSILSDDLTTTSTVLINKILKENPKTEALIGTTVSKNADEAKIEFEIVMKNLMLDDLNESQENLNIELSSEFDNVKRAEILDKITKLAIKKATLTSSMQGTY